MSVVLVLGKAAGLQRDGLCHQASPAVLHYCLSAGLPTCPPNSTQCLGQSLWPGASFICRAVTLSGQSQEQARVLRVMLNLPFFLPHNLHFHRES